jgi:protein gp37
MAENSAIEWTDATVNFWWGCTKVGPGCDHCYAETWAKRTGGGLWGVGVPRRQIKGAVKLLYKLQNGYSWWAADHYIGKINPTPQRRVFIQSMSDLFDTEVPIEWFDEAWHHIENCDKLGIQIVTKRISVIEKRLASIGVTTWPQHAGLIISVVNQAEAERDIPRLIELKAKLGIPWIGLSMEPLLGAVTLKPEWLAELGWAIVGGESGKNARIMQLEWIRTLRDQCAAAGVPFMFKQFGEWIAAAQIGFHGHERRPRFDIPPQSYMRVGKKAAGRLLDGVQHDGLPA